MIRQWTAEFTRLRDRMAFDIVRARLLLQRHVHAFGNRLLALFVCLVENRLGGAFCQRACPIPLNQSLNSAGSPAKRTSKSVFHQADKKRKQAVAERVY